MLSIDQLHSHTCAELVGMCKELGLPHSGRRKLLLVQALYEYQRNNGGIPPPVLARNSFRGAAARSQQQQAMLLQQQEPCAQLVQHIPARALPANGSAAASVSFLLQKQMHALGCAGAGQASGGGLCGSGGPGFPSPPPGVVAAGGGVTSHVATGHAASNTATAVGAPTTSSSAGGGTGQGVFGRCLCKGATGGSRGRGSHAKSLKCKTCGNLSHMSCYPGVVGAAAQKFVCSTCRMKRLDPFYPVEEVLWETRLEGSHYTVDICAHALRKWRAEGKEVIVRCMQVDQPVLYQTWPKSIQISINGRMEETVSAPSWEHKRRDTPIVITQYLKNGKNRVEFWWTNYEEAKPFHLALLLCAYSSPEALAKTLELRSHVGEAEARRRVLSIVTNKNGSPTAQQDDEDDDVTCMEVTRRIKLLCPITFTRIGLPCRGVNCMHLQCFDLSGYLLVTRNTKAFNTRWKCPECQLYVRPDELVIDDFVLQILKDTPEDATVIELEADGSYRVVSEQELKEESKRAEAQRLRAAGACRVKRAIDEETSSASPSAPTTQPEEGPSKKAFEIVEMLSSSEDEEDALAIESNSSAPTAGSAMDNTTGAVTATSVSTFQRVVAATAPAATPASTLRGEGDQAAAVPLEASTTRALPPALVSSLRSAAAAASAAAGGGLLFSPASTAATQQQQQQQESDTAPTRGDGYACSPEEEGEEQEDDEDSALRVGRFHKRPRRTALSPASSASSLAPVGSPASSLQRDQQHEIVPGGSVNEDIPGATADSVGKRISARAGVRAAAESSARVVFPKTQALAAAQFAPAFSKDLEDQQQLSTEGGDIVVISSDDEEDLVTPAWTPVVTPQQQRRQQRRQQEQERRRLQEEKREEHRKLVAQAAAAAEQHARAEEILSKGTGVVGAGTNDKQNISFSDIATLALLSPPAATASGKQTLLSNLQLNFPSAPQRAATARSVSKDSESEVRGDEAAELLQLLLERQRQELEPRENLQMQEFEQHQQRLNLRTLTSLSSEKESICHRDAPPFWQAHDRPGDSSRSSASEEKASSNSDSGNSAWSCREIATAGRGRQPYDGNNTQTVTALPDSDSPAADGSSEAAGIINADALPPRDASTHRVSAAESRGFKQGPTRLHAGTDDTLFAHDSLSAASFPEVIPPSSYPRAASPPTPHASRETAGEVVVAAPSAGPGSVGESSGFGVPAACLAPAGNYYYVDIASINMTSPSVLQQEQIFQQPAQQQVVQQPLPCGGTGDGSSPVYGVDHSTIAESSLILQTYSKAAQHAQPQQTLDHLQQQAQQVMHQNLQPQQHAEEQQSVRQQQQVAHQQAAQHLHGLQQRYELPSSHQTAEAARAAGEQVTRGETRTTDTREKEQTRSFTVRVTAGDSEKKITGYRSRRSSARGIVSRSSSPDPGRREKRNEECTRESLQQLHPAAERAPVEATSLKADTAFAPASDRVELGPSSSGRSDADSREEPPHEQQQQHRQHQQKQQRQQPPLGTTDPVVGAGDISGSHAAPPSQAADSAAGARAAAAASAADATSSVSHFVQSTAATAAPPACAVSHQQASSAAGDRKRVAADEASLTAPNAEGAHLTMSKGLERAKSLTAKGTQGATGARRGPRMSLPPRSCVAALRSDAAVTSKPAASVEHGKVAFSAAVSATVSSTPSTIPIPSSVPTTRAGPAPSTAFWGSQGHRSGLSRGTAGVAAAPSAISSVARSADGAAAAASLVRAAAAGSTAAGTGLPRSPGRRLLVPPVPPPLPSRSIKHAGGASSSGQEECNSSGCTQHGPAGSFVNPSSETSSSSSQKDPRRKQSSCPPDTAAGAAIAAAASSAVGATHAVATSATVPSSPGLRSPSDDATAAAPVCREADPGVRTIGRLATHTGENSGAPSLTCWSIHRNVNTDVGRNTGTFFDVAPCGGGLNRQRSDNADRQHESSSDNNGSSGLTCSSARRHSIEEVERLSSDVSDSPTAAGGGGIPASAVSSLRRFRIELRRHSKTRMKDDGDHTEFSHSGRDVNVSECRTNSCSRRQSGSVATNFSECSASSSTTGGNDRRNLHEMKGAVSCCTSIEVSDREQEDLLRRPPANEREFSAVHQAAQACAGSSRLMRRERIAGMTGSEAGLGTSGGESRRQKAGVADNTETAERQRTDSAIGATAADEAPLVPGQREGGRCRVSVVLSHHAASHVKPPPSAFFCTANSVTPSPSASDSPVLAGQTDSDEAHTATGASRNICNRETAQSRLRAQQTGDRADSPCLNALGLYAPALSADFHASSSRRLTEGELVEGLDAGGHATVARTWIPADGSHAESVPFTGVSAPTLDSFPPESEWKATFLNDSCSDAGGAFPLSLHAVADRPTEASRIEQTQPCFQSEAEELGQQLVPIRCSEAQGAERQHSEIRSGDAEGKTLTRSEHKENLFLGTPLLHTSSQLQPRAHRVLKWQQDTRSATPHVDVESVTCFAETAKAGQWKTDEKAGAETKGYVCSEGIAWEGFEEAAAGHQEIPWEEQPNG